jgi:hypothetical protein
VFAAKWALTPKPQVTAILSKYLSSVGEFLTARNGRFVDEKLIFINAESGLWRLVVTKIGPPPPLSEIAAVLSQKSVLEANCQSGVKMKPAVLQQQKRNTVMRSATYHNAAGLGVGLLCPKKMHDNRRNHAQCMASAFV